MSLLEQWLDGRDAVQVHDEAAVSEIRVRARESGAAVGDVEFRESCALIASELGHNQLRHVGEGFMYVLPIERGGVPGLEIGALDSGRGIPIEAFQPGRESSTSLRAGLAAVRRLAHEIDFDLRAQEGTLIRARRYSGAIGAPHQVAIVGRPLPGEATSGDQAFFRRRGEQSVACILDGVGHGPSAREAADLAVDVLLSHGEHEMQPLLAHLEAALGGSRGCVISHVSLDERSGALTHFGVGNATTKLVGPGSSRRFVTKDGIVGRPISRRGPKLETASLARSDLVIMHTDGLSSGAALTDRPDLLAAHPIDVAFHLLESFARAHDDALVMVIS